MKSIIQYEKSIQIYMNVSELKAVPRELPTESIYSEYLSTCKSRKLVPVSKTKFTRELRKYGYERVSRRMGNKVFKIYKYTGKRPRKCNHCGGKGTIYV